MQEGCSYTTSSLTLTASLWRLKGLHSNTQKCLHCPMVLFAWHRCLMLSCRAVWTISMHLFKQSCCPCSSAQTPVWHHTHTRAHSPTQGPNNCDTAWVTGFLSQQRPTPSLSAFSLTARVLSLVQMWTGARPPRPWPTTRLWPIRCASAVWRTTSRTSGMSDVKAERGNLTNVAEILNKQCVYLKYKKCFMSSGTSDPGQLWVWSLTLDV